MTEVLKIIRNPIFRIGMADQITHDDGMKSNPEPFVLQVVSCS